MYNFIIQIINRKQTKTIDMNAEMDVTTENTGHTNNYELVKICVRFTTIKPVLTTWSKKRKQESERDYLKDQKGSDYNAYQNSAKSTGGIGNSITTSVTNGFNNLFGVSSSKKDDNIESVSANSTSKPEVGIKEESEVRTTVEPKLVFKEVDFYVDKRGNHYDNLLTYYYNKERDHYKEDVNEENVNKEISLYPMAFSFELFLGELPGYIELAKYGKILAKGVSEVSLVVDEGKNSADIIEESITAVIEEEFHKEGASTEVIDYTEYSKVKEAINNLKDNVVKNIKEPA